MWDILEAGRLPAARRKFLLLQRMICAIQPACGEYLCENNVILLHPR